MSPIGDVGPPVGVGARVEEGAGKAVAEDGPDEVRARAGTAVALGSVAGIAVLVVAVLVAGMRLTEPDTAAAVDIGVEDEVPTALAGGVPLGEVPEAIAAAVDEPVVAAVATDEPPEGVGRDCGHGAVAVDDPTTRVTVVITPDLVETLLVGPPGDGVGMGDGVDMGAEPMPMPAPPPPPIDEPLPPIDEPPPPVPLDAPAEMRWMEQCQWQPTGDGTWQPHGGMSGTFDEASLDGSGTSMSCCDDGFATATTSLRPPDDAAWALQDRGVYWLAYPLGELRSVPITWRYRQGAFGDGRGTTHVLWLDEAGTVIDERYVSS